MVTYTDRVTMCFASTTVSIQGISDPQGLNLELSNGAFADSNDIIATITGDGTYEYTLDNGAPQESNVFSNVSPGPHTVTAADIRGCGSISATIFVIGFPNFFTPNNDGTNDVWNVLADIQTPDMDIFIFDKYGKLLTQLVPNGAGWDGTYNGVPLPATDYWFMAKLKDGSQTFRSHFTLKR